jgi:hypothetical protein
MTTLTVAAIFDAFPYPCDDIQVADMGAFITEIEALIGPLANYQKPILIGVPVTVNSDVPADTIRFVSKGAIVDLTYRARTKA